MQQTLPAHRTCFCQASATQALCSGPGLRLDEQQPGNFLHQVVMTAAVVATAQALRKCSISSTAPLCHPVLTGSSCLQEGSPSTNLAILSFKFYWSNVQLLVSLKAP